MNATELLETLEREYRLNSISHNIKFTDVMKDAYIKALPPLTFGYPCRSCFEYHTCNEKNLLTKQEQVNARVRRTINEVPNRNAMYHVDLFKDLTDKLRILIDTGDYPKVTKEVFEGLYSPIFENEDNRDLLKIIVLMFFRCNAKCSTKYEDKYIGVENRARSIEDIFSLIKSYLPEYCLDYFTFKDIENILFLLVAFNMAGTISCPDVKGRVFYLRKQAPNTFDPQYISVSRDTYNLFDIILFTDPQRKKDYIKNIKDFWSSMLEDDFTPNHHSIGSYLGKDQYGRVINTKYLTQLLQYHNLLKTEEEKKSFEISYYGSCVYNNGGSQDSAYKMWVYLNNFEEYIEIFKEKYNKILKYYVNKSKKREAVL